MKIILICLLVFSSPLSAANLSPSASQSKPVGQPSFPPVPTHLSAETYFLKVGGGAIFEQVYADENDSYFFDKTPVFIPSLAIGIDCPDHFSYYGSLDWFAPMDKEFGAGDCAFLANAQYTVPIFGIFKPYLFSGFGLDVGAHREPFGFGFQLGTGAGFEVDPNVTFYVEMELYYAGIFLSYENRWLDIDFPVLSGLKLDL